MTLEKKPLLTDHDEPLLPLIAAGEPHAVNRCIRRYGPLVWALARRFSPTSADAEDAVQEIFMDLWANAGRFDRQRGSERVFVTILARRRLIDRLRSSSRRRAQEIPLEELPEVEDSGAMHAERDADIDMARRVLAQLPAEQQRVITLCLAHGYSHSEAAHHTGLPLGTIKTMVRRGVLRVRSLLSAGASAAPAGEDAS